MLNPNRVLCAGCNKPIHIDKFGGIEQIAGKQFWFHNNIVCIIEVNRIIQEHLEKMAKPEVKSIKIAALQ